LLIQTTADSKPETVVFLVSADPKPRNYIAFTQAKLAIMIADPDYTNPVTASFKMECRTIWVAFPRWIGFSEDDGCEIAGGADIGR
jgi:hypothetical protein